MKGGRHETARHQYAIGSLENNFSPKLEERNDGGLEVEEDQQGRGIGVSRNESASN